MKQLKKYIAAIVAMAAVAYAMICICGLEAETMSAGAVWLRVIAAAAVEWIALKAMEIDG